MIRTLMRHRLARARGDRGSLPMVMLIAIIGVGLSAVLLPVLLRMNHSTLVDTYRNNQLGAAESGIDVLLGEIRSSYNSQGQGVTAGLPCANPGTTPITGSVDDASLTYSVSMTYYIEDPTGQSEQWLQVWDPTSAPNGHGMRCQVPDGTYLPQGPPSAPSTCPTGYTCNGPAWNTSPAMTPSYVRITSTGSDGHGERTLRATYKVQTTNANVSGGTIYIYPSGGTNYCIAATSAVPAYGTPVHLKACKSATQPRQEQLWAYQSDLSIQLVSSVSTTNPNGLCLTDDTVYQAPATITKNGVTQTNPAAIAENNGDSIALEQCAPVGSAPWYQQWSVDGNANLRGATPPSPVTKTGGININSLCIYVGSQADNVGLTVSSTCGSGGVTDVNRTWVESPDVGAGTAGPDVGDVVNFQQFARCLDVTNQKVDGTWTPPPSSSNDANNAGGNNYLIAYTCKQNPNKKLDWNQVFIYQPSTLHWVTCPGAAQGWNSISSCSGSLTPYCLSSPLTAIPENEPHTSPAAGTKYNGSYYGPYVTVVKCSTCPATHDANDNCMWTQYGGADQDGNPQPVGVKYTIQDARDNCMDVTSGTGDLHVGQYSKVIVATCSTDPATAKSQEWNGAADVQTPIVQGYTEIANPAG